MIPSILHTLIGNYIINFSRCHFHFAKCIWKQVVNAGLKVEYSKKKDNEALVELIVAAIGMAYVPLEELKVGIFNNYFIHFIFNTFGGLSLLTPWC